MHPRKRNDCKTALTKYLIEEDFKILKLEETISLNFFSAIIYTIDTSLEGLVGYPLDLMLICNSILW